MIYRNEIENLEPNCQRQKSLECFGAEHKTHVGLKCKEKEEEEKKKDNNNNNNNKTSDINIR
jgi:hypothetical protein